MKKQLLLVVLFYHAFASSDDVYKAAFEISRFIAVIGAAIIVPSYMQNPPQTNFREYFSHKLFNETNADHEIKKLTVLLQDLTKKIDTTHDEHDKLMLGQEKEELENKILKLEKQRKITPPLFTRANAKTMTKEEAEIHQTVQKQIIVQALNLQQSPLEN